MNEDESKILDYPSDKKDPDERYSRYELRLRWAMLVAFAVFFIGWLFKVQQWPYGSVLLILSLSSLSLFGILRYLLRKRKTIEDYLLMLVYSIPPIAFLFQVLHWKGGTEMLIAGGISFFLYLVVRVVKSFGKN